MGCRRGVKHTADFRPDEHIAGDVPDPDLHHQAGQPNLPFAARGSFPLTKPIVGIGGTRKAGASVHSGAMERLSSVMNRISVVD